jgi:hypothetical protein
LRRKNRTFVEIFLKNNMFCQKFTFRQATFLKNRIQNIKILSLRREKTADWHKKIRHSLWINLNPLNLP